MAEEFNIFDTEAEFNIFDEPDIFDERTFGKRLERGAIAVGESFGAGVIEFVKLPVRALKAASEFLIPEKITAGEKTLIDLSEEKQAVSQFFEGEIAGVEKLGKRLGFIQEEFQPETAFERTAVATGREIGVALFPLGAQFQAAKNFKRVLTEAEGLIAKLLRETAENPTLTALVETGLTASAGAGLGIAAEVAPDSPTAQVVGGLIGVLGPIGGLRVLQRVRSGLTPNLAIRETVPQGVKSEDLAGNINLNNFDTTDQAKQLMRDTAAANSEFIGARRGEIPLAETDATARQLIADDIGIPVGKIGQAFNAEELTGLRIMLADSSENVVGLSSRINAGDNSSEAISSLQTAMVRHSALQEQVSGATAEAGRTLSALRITARTEKQRLQLLDELIKSGGGRENIEELAAKIVTIDDPAALNRFIKNSQKATFLDKALEIYINELLSGPQTHVTNIVSNAFFATYQIPERLLAGIISKAGTREISLLEAPAQVLGFIQGIKDGGLLAAKSFKTGVPAFGVGKIDLPRKKAIGGKTGEFVRLPGKALMAADDFFKGIGYRMELNTLAVRQTIKELGPASPSNAGAFSRRFTELVQNPTPKMIDRASEQATIQTFTNRLGPTGEKVAAIRNPAFRIVAPFIRTPTNIAKQALKRIPVTAPFMQSFRAELKAGGAAREQALARVALGTVLGGTVAAYATEGLITGAGPSDPETRRVWLEDHQPFSIRVGDEWIAYGRIEPFATIMGLAADLGSLGGEASPEELDDMATFLTISMTKNLTNKTFLQGMTNAIEAINDPDRFGSEFITNFAATIATPSIIAQTARTTDPTLRETRPDETIGLGKTELLFQEILNKIKARTPGFSDTLPPKIGLWGEAISFEGGLGPDIISPIYTRKWKNDFITQEILRLDASPGFIPRQAFEVDLSPEEFTQLSQIAGKSARKFLESIVLSPAWDTMPDALKKLTIEQTFKSSRDLARARILPLLVGRVKEASKTKAKKFTQ